MTAQALAGLLALAAAAGYLVDGVRRYKYAGAGIDGGHAATDYDALRRCARRWAAIPIIATVLAFASAVVSLTA